jgi:hypothetical protein
MGLVNWLILRSQLSAMRKTHPEMAADVKRFMAEGHSPADAIRLATKAQARRNSGAISAANPKP